MIQRRPQINPRTIKKSSQISQSRDENAVLSLGEREFTDIGYKIPGFSGAAFETFVECLASGAATAKMVHKAKDRLVRVLSGILTVQVGDSTVKATPGTEIAIEAGKEFRLSNTATMPTEYMVVQASKYSARLEELEPAVPVSVEPTTFKAPDFFDTNILTPRTRTSKAVEQMRELTGDRDRVVIRDAKVTAVAHNASVNPMPFGAGSFDDAGAG